MWAREWMSHPFNNPPINVCFAFQYENEVLGRKSSEFSIRLLETELNKNDAKVSILYLIWKQTQIYKLATNSSVTWTWPLNVAVVIAEAIYNWNTIDMSVVWQVISPSSTFRMVGCWMLKYPLTCAPTGTVYPRHIVIVSLCSTRIYWHCQIINI